jgi:hypothetical protein
MGVENAQATIYGILGLMVVLVVGTLLLATVDPKPQVITD